MSFPRHLFTGAGLGLAAGCVSSSYLWGSMNNPQRKHEKYVFCILPGECFDATAFVKSISAAEIFFTPPLYTLGGAASGAGIFAARKGIKYLRQAPKPVQLATIATITALFAGTLAYNIGKKS